MQKSTNIVDGIRVQKLELAIQSYSQRKVDLRGGAAMAGVDYMHFTQAVQARNIVVLEDSHFTDQLAFLAQALNDQTLQQAVDQLRTQVL